MHHEPQIYSICWCFYTHTHISERRAEKKPGQRSLDLFQAHKTPKTDPKKKNGPTLSPCVCLEFHFMFCF